MRQEIHINYHRFESWKELPQMDQDLIVKAYGAAANAYAPYSKFHVGAALLLEDGEVVLGNNQENIAFPSGLCAERTALFYAGANHPGKIVKKIIIVAKGDFVPLETLLSPCGACRQVMMETETRQQEPMQIILVSESGTTIILNSVHDLLPFAFLKN